MPSIDIMEEIIKKLVERGIQPTAMRQLVLEYLLDQTHAISLSDLEKGLAHTDRATLYRTLKTFESKGILHSVIDGTGTLKYALCGEGCKHERHGDQHLHFYCERCGETVCIPSVGIVESELPDGFVAQELNLLAKGICKNCRKR